MTPTLVVVAYNRPDSLQRLLRSLQTAVYPAGESVRLIISIDGGGGQNRAVQTVAQAADWPHGLKDIIVHEQNLGLIDHLFSCGDLSEVYGRIILLEDDLVVSPAFYAYASQALDFYADEPQIGGISLNALWFNGFNHLPFTPYLDGGDTFFMQIAWFHGQAYTAAQWRAFREWYKTNDRPVVLDDGLHPAFTRFASTEWFPRKTRFLVDTGRFYLFPRTSYTVNFGDTGTHFVQETRFFQLPLQMGQAKLRFLSWADSLAVYDDFQEIIPDRLKRLAPHLADFDFVVDFYGERPIDHVSTRYILTTQPSRQSLFRYGLVMRPAVANVIHQIEGDEIVLSATVDIEFRRLARFRAAWVREAYYKRLRPMGRRQKLRLAIGRWLVSMGF